MPRNTSGVYSLPVAAFSPGDVIKSSDHNSNYNDIATALSQSLATTGVSIMTGPFQAATGTVSNPSITFASGTATGFYLAGTNKIGWAAAGAVGGSFNADGSLDVVGAITSAGNPVATIPSGTALVAAMASAPTGWTKSTAHNDKALRVVSGSGGGSGGSTAFSSIFTARTISTGNMPSHTHGVTESPHTHYLFNSSVGGAGTPTLPGQTYAMYSQAVGNYYSDYTILGSGTAPTIGQASSASTGLSIQYNGNGNAMDFSIQYVDVIIIVKN